LAQLNGQAVYSFDNNGNLKNSDTLSNTWDAANRLIASERDGTLVEPIYNGVNDRVGQTVGLSTTNFALDVAAGLPEVIYTSDGDAYLHLPGVIVAKSSTGETRYLLSDGLGSVRQAVDDTAAVVAYYEFDPYGNPIDNTNSGDPYGYTGEWYEGYMHLLHLRARWYSVETGTFLNRDPWLGNISRPDTLHGYSYAGNNPILYRDASGLDYLPWLDRYTCDDPLARGGYTSHYDIATGTWGLWPCIVDPNNVPPRQPGPVVPLKRPKTSVPPLLQPSSSLPSPGVICDPEKPCKVILGANRVNTFGQFVEQFPPQYRKSS
ncbi:MAG: RHS repeat-associated core domain-containing protein, partial [Chloroflexi bacterium]|nr:RHS repeat-associated core domain-containing protein [Chloroflexota bacterium]